MHAAVAHRNPVRAGADQWEAQVLINRLMDSLRHDGWLKTSAKVLSYPVRRLTHPPFEKILQSRTVEQRFTWIYRHNHWQSAESASGTGSTLSYTKNLRNELPALVRRLSVSRILDAPCGDFHWMSAVLPELAVDYTGADIVRPLVKSLNRRFANATTRFVHIDLIRDRLPPADLMICRDCLFHLSFADTRAVLENFVAAEIPYLLTTTHRNEGKFLNKDIRTGNFRLIDLFAPPYLLPSQTLARIDDWMAPEPERQMCLWTREQVARALQDAA